ncbi:MAG TPA: ATP-binding protein [Janthinobacterium sp.]|jgi:signal transduction histidine kinase|nr:ATP-binding protein [Janthinobacterium sp.]
MEMFALDDEVAQWELALLPLRGAARLPVQVPLAWHLRQRDSARAAALAEEARQLLPLAALAPSAQTLIAARLQLVLAETVWLSGDLDAAATLALQALDTLCRLPDPAGCADAHWALAWIAVDRGDHARCDAELEQAAAAGREAGDHLRVAIAEAASARWAVMRDMRLAAAHWSKRFASDTRHLHPALATWINDFRGLLASQSHDVGAAAGHYICCYEAALETGQLRAAITTATNTGEYFTKLNDHRAALEWMECALDLARPTGWPRSIGACLMHTADTMRRLGRLEAAEELLQEALHILAPLAGARSYAMALHYLGDLSLDKGDYDAALDAFQRLAQRADALDHSDFQSAARRGAAHALSYLDRPEEALDMAQTAVLLAERQRHAYNHIAALRVLAMIHQRHDGLAPPQPMTALNPALHYLHEAASVAAGIEGYILPGDLLDALAREYANAGEYAQAYDIALEAGAAREKTHSQEATNRAIAMQVHHHTAHARAEGQHHRELAASEARRAEVLQQTSATLERLSVIGQEITTHLDAGAVFQALDRHVHALLPTSTFEVFMSDQDGLSLSRAYGVEAGRRLQVHTIPLSQQHDDSVRCFLERREVYIDQASDKRNKVPEPGSLDKQSAIFAPLTVGERALGVMTVQALHPQAYGERERLIFRSLCAYAAIALDNANAYRQLKDAQAQLVSQEKLAALGSLMAGVAHELNTPIGNSLLIASTMQQRTDDVERMLNGPGLRRSELVAYIADAHTAAQLVMRGLTTAADLVNSFKQVAVDRTTEQRRVFNLQQVAHEIIATMMNRIRGSGHSIEFEVSDLIVMDSYPGPFGQVVTNLINNALLHAFDGAGSGRMWLTAGPAADGRVQIVFRDNGCGIAEENRQRIFDPFFTTKLGQGGSGLGLSISYNIVTSLLGGQIGVGSDAGGCTFTLDLPLTAPRHDPARPASIY